MTANFFAAYIIMATYAPATPKSYGGDAYETPVETLEWTAPDWYNPRIPVPRSVQPTGATMLVPVISMMPVRMDMGRYVRAFDSMPIAGHSLFDQPNPPLPLEVLGSGLAPPLSPAPGEGPWTKFPQYSPELRPISEFELPSPATRPGANTNTRRSDM